MTRERRKEHGERKKMNCFVVLGGLRRLEFLGNSSAGTSQARYCYLVRARCGRRYQYILRGGGPAAESEIIYSTEYREYYTTYYIATSQVYELQS